MYFPVNLRAVADDTTVDNCPVRNILRGQVRAVGIDLPEFFVEVELRNDIDQFHVRFPIRTERSHIFPIAVVLIGKQPVPFAVAVRNDMLSEIAVRLVFQPDQRIFQNRPDENVNPHRCQITARMLRLLLKFTDLAVRIRHDDPEPTGFLDRNRHRRDRDIRFI